MKTEIVWFGKRAMDNLFIVRYNLIFDIRMLNKSVVKRFVIFVFLGCSLTSFVFSQDGVHAREGRFLKRIEHNKYMSQYNLAGKEDFEKRFFGDFNARVEFFCNPSREYSGFRIVRKGSSYILEVKYVSNFKELEKMFEDKLKAAWTNHNFDEARKIGEEKERLYKVATRSVPISNHFADKLYDRMVSFIGNFEATEVDHPDIVPVMRDGDPVTFRTVVKAELWSLYIPCPQGDALKMAHLCREIITDVRADKFSESKYIYEIESL
jgi:hypothetical protein